MHVHFVADVGQRLDSDLARLVVALGDAHGVQPAVQKLLRLRDDDDDDDDAKGRQEEKEGDRADKREGRKPKKRQNDKKKRP